MAIEWDVRLPDYLYVDGAAGAFGDNNIRSKMEVGPAKMRRRSTAAPDTFTGVQYLTSTQVGYLDTFYKVSTAGGSLQFTWKHPRTRAACQMRFLAPPTWVPVGGIEWEVTLQLEIMP